MNDLTNQFSKAKVYRAKLWRSSDGGGKRRESEEGGARLSAGRVMCLHGYQDNCASFDRLVPLLDRGNEYLCLDLPNHGRSTGTPAGVRWTLEHYAVAVERAARHARWSEPFACVGHSMGGQIAKLYAALYPDRVRKLVMLDTAGPVVVDPDEVVHSARRAADQQLKLEDRMKGDSPAPPPPVYTRAQALARIRARTYSRLTERSAETLLTRYLRPGPFVGQFLLANDARLKVSYSEWFSEAQHRDVVNSVRCPVLLVRATYSDAYYDDIYGAFVDMYAERPNFRTVHVQGDHDVHMNHPHRVASLINAFLNSSSSKL